VNRNICTEIYAPEIYAPERYAPEIYAPEKYASEIYPLITRGQGEQAGTRTEIYAMKYMHLKAMHLKCMH
jgi:hypothetical protein